MAPTALLNAFLYVDGWDATADSRALSLQANGAELDKTTFRSNGWEEATIGAKNFQFSFDGFWSAGAGGTPDTDSFDNIGLSKVVTAGDVETEGMPAVMFQGGRFGYTYFGPHGQLAPFSLDWRNMEGTAGVILGALAVEKTSTTTTGAKGTALNLGLVGAGRYLYSTLHLLGTAGSSITAVVESDEDSGFATATTRITFGPLTAVGGSWGTRVAGAIADDDWFRLRVTAITGTWVIGCAIGIGA